MGKIHRLGESLARCNMLAGGSIDDNPTPTGNNYSYKSSNDLSNSNNDNQQTKPKSLSASYGYGNGYGDGQPRTRGRVPYGKIIETDPLFQIAWREWGVFKGALINQVKKVGVTAARRIVGMVERLPDEYFQDPRPIPLQRGGYAMQCLKTYNPKYDDWRWDEKQREGRTHG